MLLFLFAIASGWAQAQTAETVKFQANNSELSYLHVPGSGAVLVVIPPETSAAAAEVKNWGPVAASRKWRLVVPQFPAGGDAGVLNLRALDADLRSRYQIEKDAFYLVGSGPSSAVVFYAAARAPYLWTAALAISGSPLPAIDTDRLFAGNTLNVPFAWALSQEERAATAAVRQRLTTAGFNLHVLEAATVGAALEFLGKYSYSRYPSKLDCETGSPTFARCYWINLTAFDPALRNDVVRSSRVNSDLPASLDLGGFGYQADAPGPGVLVEWLPEGYDGKLKLKDRIVALSGKPIVDAKHYHELMREVKDERPVSVTVERMEGKEKERLRIATRYQLRQRQEVITARVQAEYAPQAHEIIIVTRAVAALEITIPPDWVPATVNWNGNQVASPNESGCLSLSLKEPGAARPCAAKP